jgi:PEP-CTERM motif-containing protein
MKFIWTFFLAAGLLAATPMTTTVKLVNAGNPSTLVVDGTFIGPYTLQINGQNYAAMCIDFSDETSVGTSWLAYETSVAGGDFSKTYQHTDWNVAKEYEEEAYLFSQITKSGISSTTRTDIQEAAWKITDPSYHPTDPSGVNAWITQAQNNYASLNLSGFQIISSVGTPHQQEFIVFTPEPGSFALLGAGLMVAGIAGRKRFAGRKAS